MTSEPARRTSQSQDADRDDPLEAAKLQLKQKDLDIASQMRSVKQAEPDLVRAVGNYSASVVQTLGVIEAIEETLQHKRKQIDEIQARQAVLAREYRELGETLERATKDLARQFTRIIHSLETDAAIAPPAAEPSAKAASETGTATATRPTAEPAAETTLELGLGATVKAAETASAISAEPSTRGTADEAPDGAPKADETSDLDLDLSDLPPVPEFLGNRDKVADPKDGGSSEDSGLSALGWWRHGKK